MLIQVKDGRRVDIAIAQALLVDLAVVVVQFQTLGIGIREWAEHILTLWADQIRTKAITEKLVWYRFHGAKYK
jgi:hypothetical protein